jgi:MinD-like ATPase involved in chromosome partitioning or flagellar assembly
MEALLVAAISQKGRELILPLSLGGVRVRKLLGAGEQLLAELDQAPTRAVILTESLPDGPAEHWLGRLSGSPGRPLVVVLLQGIEAATLVRERCRAVYGPLVEVVPAGLPPPQAASQAALLLERLQEEVMAAGAAAPQAEPVSSGQSRGEGQGAPPTPGATPTLGATPTHAATPTQAPQPAQTTQPAQPAQPLRPVRYGALALLGASGGVGTSTLTANLAALVTKAGGKVLVIDLGQTQAYLLGAQPDEAVRGLHHLRWAYLSGRPGTPAEVAPWLDHARGIDLLILPPILDALWHLPAEQILWGLRALEPEYDLVLFDLGTGISHPRTPALIEAANQTLLVVGGWGSGLHGASALLAALEGRPERDRLSLILREGDPRSATKALGLPIEATLPAEPLLTTASRQERAPPPLVVQAPDSPYANAVRSLAVALGLLQPPAPAAPAPRERRGLFGLVRR